MIARSVTWFVVKASYRVRRVITMSLKCEKRQYTHYHNNVTQSPAGPKARLSSYNTDFLAKNSGSSGSQLVRKTRWSSAIVDLTIPADGKAVGQRKIVLPFGRVRLGAAAAETYRGAIRRGNL